MIVHGPYPVGEPRVVREARVALQEGFEVTVVAMRRGNEPAAESVEGVDVHRLGISHRRGGGALALLREYVGFTLLATVHVARLARRERFAIVHVHNPPDFLMLAALAPRLLGSRIVFDVHDFAVDMLAMRFEGRPGFRGAARLMRMVERCALRISDAVVTVHEPYRRALLERGLSPAKSIVVMNALDEWLLPAGAPPERDGAFRVFYHGTITPPYGVHLIVEAAALIADEVPSLLVEIVGEGDSVGALRNRARELGIAKRVVVLDRYLPHSEALARAHTASVGVIPNLPTRLNHYALSSKLFEYVALGVPVVCSRLPTLREHFEEEELSFFEPGRADDLAAKLLAVYRDPESAATRAGAALARYRAAYRWSTSAQRLAEIFDVLAAEAAVGVRRCRRK